MIQKDLLEKEAIEKEKCSECGKYVSISELGIVEIYHPFDDIPSFIQENVCRNCRYEILDYSDSMYCGACDRQIFNNNGYRQNLRIYPEFPEQDDFVDDVICVACCQDIWFEVGMLNFDDGDFFNDSDLVENGFVKDKSYFCRNKECYDKAEKRFVELREKGLAVIVSIEASGMGLEHYFSLWIKEIGDFNE